MRTQNLIKKHSDLTPKGKFPKRDHIGLMSMTPSNHEKRDNKCLLGNFELSASFQTFVEEKMFLSVIR